ncbi:MULTISPECIES: EAL domain-containing protein [unclassified Paenibacillus]|uniref:sensor domain-containing protein n=1 Tax=unclassified Paenibacillus TaxID=185978 RepID=UPI001AE858E8|nr:MULTISPECIES: EAL domain-containing protein [unclassified Paenibacillus]MBP1156646.1 diguanylate cyclase (GGDEF)-like protein/PAS domain S-box-containing protein [Paenibacillus sp. PvP091]MBP1172616.1 diguanylate cyclase (GGDEF)-like protein/PAS domain S-box-containing protein [Paenibacillus sp. PvR098]MBP2438996.1 diguanylate cyclase (GGDEF)-like protein/PAS domain S-box-containing protein [Paenibacillus sp. PvP052]
MIKLVNIEVREMGKNGLANELLSLYEMYRSIFENHPDACYAFDLQGNFMMANQSCERIFGYSREELLTMTFVPFFKEEDVNTAFRYFTSAANGNQEVVEMKVRHKNGHFMDLNITLVPIFIDHKIQGVIGIGRDVSEQNLTQKELISSKNQLQNIFNSLDACFWSHDVVTNTKAIISPACEKIYGYSQHFFISDPLFWIKVIHPDDKDKVQKYRQRIYTGESVKQEYRIIHATGQIKWVSDHTIPVFNERAELIRLDGLVSDITQRKVAEEQLYFMAFHDVLTGLPNRRMYRNKLDKALANAQDKYKVVVMYLDLDRFKYVNDSLGHMMGDRLLQIVADRLKACLDEEDTISRQGGDEFTILLNKVASLEHIYPIANKILDTIVQPIRLDHHEFILTTSVGVSVYPDHGQDSHTLIKQADQAMYLAKEHGKNNFKLYEPDITTISSRKWILEQSLRKAMKNDELSLHYQPIVDLRRGSMIGLEALVRWHQSELGYIPPTEFIPIAEECGLIIPIGEWILRSACMQNKLWQKKGYHPIFVSVNISARQFENANFVPMVESILSETRLEPQYLKLEITESTAMSSAEDMIKRLEKLQALGVHLSIDDFGTGYSSLSYLKKFQIGTLKIDQSFIKDINIDPNQEAIINAIVAMAKNLRIHVIAEGVELLQQVEFLKNIGCYDMQGYFFSKPLATEHVERLFGKKL